MSLSLSRLRHFEILQDCVTTLLWVILVVIDKNVEHVLLKIN